MKKPILIEILIWFILLTAIFCAGIFAYSKLFIEPNIYNIQFKDIDGITKGSPVRFMGINIGYVRSLKAKDNHINVQIVVTQKDMKIPNGTIARVEFYGLGGSKSIELMPADENGAQGIVSASTLRLHDIIIKSENIVEILEAVEKTVKGLNKSALHNILENFSHIDKSKVDNLSRDLETFEKNITNKTENIRKKQKETKKRIQKLNANTENLNKFIKK